MNKLSLIAVISFLCLAKASAADPSVKIQGQVEINPVIKIILIKGQTISVSDGLDFKSISEKTSEGFGAFLSPQSPIQIKNCQNANVEVSADVGNFIPSADGSEVYIAPRVLNFSCND